MNGNAAQGGNPLRASLCDDVGVRPHPLIMHNALHEGKRLLRYAARYAFCMTTPNQRLREARAKKFETASEAAEALGVKRSTYIGHENGHRGFPAKSAPQYARKFGVSEEWLLYGKGEGASNLIPTEEQLADMLVEAQRELPANLTIGDWPRTVASALRAQLERFADVGLATGDPEDGPKTSPGKSARSPRPTKPDDRAGSRTT